MADELWSLPPAPLQPLPRPEQRAERGTRWTKLDGLAPYPLRGETRFVRLEEVPVHATREASGRVVETLKLGTEVQLLAQDPPGAADPHLWQPQPAVAATA